MLPKALQDLARHFEKYPGIGPRQAGRFSFFLMKQPSGEIDNLITALTALKKEVSLCSNCYLPTQKSRGKLCTICSDTKRDASSICVVERESDALNMEKMSAHKGAYLVLGENISPLHKSNIAKSRLMLFVKKLKNAGSHRLGRGPAESGGGKREIILALNNTREGNFTSLYIQELFKKNMVPNVKITRLGRGLSTGSELEYADEETLRNALEGRK